MRLSQDIVVKANRLFRPYLLPLTTADSLVATTPTLPCHCTVFADDLRFSPVTDTLTGPDSNLKPFEFSDPSGNELPPREHAPGEPREHLPRSSYWSCQCSGCRLLTQNLIVSSFLSLPSKIDVLGPKSFAPGKNFTLVSKHDGDSKEGLTLQNFDDETMYQEISLVHSFNEGQVECLRVKTGSALSLAALLTVYILNSIFCRWPRMPRSSQRFASVVPQ